MSARERILIVEDDAMSARLFSILLTAAGREVRSAVHAEAALQMLDTFSPHLIVMDMQLPKMSGYDLATRLKADPKTASIWIIAATASAMSGDEQRARVAGCNAYITKPIDGVSFVDLVHRVLAVGTAPNLSGP